MGRLEKMKRLIIEEANKRVLNESEDSVEIIDSLISDVDLEDAIDSEQEMETPEVILDLEKNPPKWYSKLKKRIEIKLRHHRGKKRDKRRGVGQSDYKRKKENKKVLKSLGIGAAAQAAIITILYNTVKKFRDIVNNISIEGKSIRIQNESTDFEYGTDLDSGGYQNKIRHEYNIKLQFNTTVIDDETGEEWEGETIEELLDIPDSYEEGLKIFQQTKDKLERNKK